MKIPVLLLSFVAWDFANKLRNPLGCSYIKTILKDQLFKTSGLQFSNWLFGPENFSTLSRNRHLDANSGWRWGRAATYHLKYKF